MFYLLLSHGILSADEYFIIIINPTTEVLTLRLFGSKLRVKVGKDRHTGIR